MSAATGILLISGIAAASSSQEMFRYTKRKGNACLRTPVFLGKFNR